MRGVMAKILRGYAKDGKGQLDRERYKELKKAFKADKTGQEPKLDKNPRWYRSPLHRAKMTQDGLHFKRHKPLHFIGAIFADLSPNGRSRALWLARIAERVDKPTLRHLIQDFKENYATYL